METLLAVNFGEIDSGIAFLSSMAIILGAIFVVLEIRDNKKMIQAATEQAKAAAIQAESSAKQTQQNIDIADMDIIMRLYEFANTREAQTSYLTVVNSNLKSYDDFLKLPREDQVSFLQVSSLFESIGVLLDRGIITLQTVDDMFVPQIAWQKLKPFMDGVSANVIGSDNFPYFAKLVKAMEARAREMSDKKGA
ncbi:MAG: hypothetical protein OK449_01415 [Thaumarchaeota archaeon]|nr:hypothetical protein [Nitrososphaerota archaeon]